MLSPAQYSLTLPKWPKTLFISMLVIPYCYLLLFLANCSTPPDKSLSSVEYSTTLLGDTAKYTCHNHYTTIIGPEFSATCRNDSFWDSPPPCIGKWWGFCLFVCLFVLVGQGCFCFWVGGGKG